MVLWPEVGGVDGWRGRGEGEEREVAWVGGREREEFFFTVLTNLPSILTENITGVPSWLTE